ncbi:hypothetical protein DFH27DRAFT_528400 [Peziza echinospora]|nr:hypothetical protein DFH27DRAFT_528400 [Peziza echinospora]
MERPRWSDCLVEALEQSIRTMRWRRYFLCGANGYKGKNKHVQLNAQAVMLRFSWLQCCAAPPQILQFAFGIAFVGGGEGGISRNRYFKMIGRMEKGGTSGSIFQQLAATFNSQGKPNVADAGYRNPPSCRSKLDVAWAHVCISRRRYNAGARFDSWLISWIPQFQPASMLSIHISREHDNNIHAQLIFSQVCLA